jgi:hypothetical protein
MARILQRARIELAHLFVGWRAPPGRGSMGSDSEAS